MLDDVLQQLDQMLAPDGPEAPVSEALIPFAEPGVLQGAEHPGTDALLAPAQCPLVLPPGSTLHAHHMSLVDPLTNMSSYGFEAFSMHHDHGLIDTNGDGVFDRTCWGTPVIEIEPYVRADGTLVEGHYRTTPDGHTWNNLNHR